MLLNNKKIIFAYLNLTQLSIREISISSEFSNDFIENLIRGFGKKRGDLLLMAMVYFWSFKLQLRTSSGSIPKIDQISTRKSLIITSQIIDKNPVRNCCEKSDLAHFEVFVKQLNGLIFPLIYFHRIFTDENRKFLQWTGDVNIRNMLQGRLVTVHLACRVDGELRLDYSNLYHNSFLFFCGKPGPAAKSVNTSPCISFRVVGSPVKTTSSKLHNFPHNSRRMPHVWCKIY